ncbi:MAG: acyclic terpene utilization AtuA family protein [Candidatus Zixiibacteriota bacterium]
MKSIIRIGNAGGYWGDDLSALKRQLQGGQLDYITMDFLAEITMSIMQKQRATNPELGYATDFIDQLQECLPIIVEKNVRVITNAGGINPLGLGQRIVGLATKMGLKIKVGVVSGDDILSGIDHLVSLGEKFSNMETGEKFEDIRTRVTSANIYFGAAPVVKALDAGCQIVVTGRVTDTGITLAPMIHEFGWAHNDWDKLAAGIIAGHIIECGAQSSGGNISDWHDVKTFQNIGYPIVEIEPSGEFTVTKHPNTGGLVSEKTVKEQLVYEMGDPSNYITPDVIACFDTIQIKKSGKDRVRVFGIKGKPATQFLKVSMSFDDGFKASGELLVCGPEAYAKAKVISEIFWKKVGHTFEATDTAVVGAGSCWPKQLSPYEANEIFLKFGALDHDPSKLKDFGKALSTVILSGPAGMAVTGKGRPKPSPVVAYWPALMNRNNAKARAYALTDGGEQSWDIDFHMNAADLVQPAPIKKPKRALPKLPSGKIRTGILRDLCYARSGDKGDTANVGVLARSPEAYTWIIKNLTVPKVKSFFKGITKGKVVRYELDNLQGLNFLLEETLGGGGTKSLLTDPQGKTLAQALLQMEIKYPAAILKTIK